jgi:ankyrin repeat protein
LLLASPFDVQYLRDMAMRLHSDLVGNPPEPDAVGLFAWEKDTKDDPFDDRLPAQVQIPSPRDPLCVGVIAFLGEWIGRDLPRDHDKSPLMRLDAEDDRLPYRLVHPWRDGAEETGGFPLTGSTFEILTAIAAIRDPQVTDKPRLLLRFVGPTAVADESDPRQANWGNRRLRETVVNDFKKVVGNISSDAPDEQYQYALTQRRTKLAKIDSHLRKLQNFYRYLSEELGHVPKTVADEADAEKEVRRFLRDTMSGRVRLDPEDAFKGLGVYDVHDKAAYFGREREVTAAVQRIEALWNDESATHLYWVRGQSGSGKSSFLRAGLIGHICDGVYSGTSYVRLAVRSNQLASNGVASVAQELHWPLRRLFCHCMAALRNISVDDPALSDELVAFDAAEGDPGAWSVERLRLALASSDDGGTLRLVLGLDQFEEAVDLLEDPSRKPAWDELISFVLQLARLPAVMVIATMRDDRAGVLKYHRALEENYRATGAASPPLELPTGDDMEEIIRKPFTAVRALILEPKLIRTLLERLRAFSAEGSARNAPVSSYLPLIGLTLQRLYREVAKPLIEEYRNFGRRASAPAAHDAGQDRTSEFSSIADREAGSEGGAYLTVEIAEHYKGRNYLDVKGAIEVLAEEAVQAAKDETGPNWDDFEVAGVLRLLVSWAGSPDQPFSLPAVAWPKGSVGRVLIEAMKKRRLVVNDDGGRIRLIHEAVVWNWPAAKAWLTDELELLKDVRKLVGLAEMWQVDAHPGELIDFTGKRFLRSALRFLALWFDLFDDADRANDPNRKALLRDFCLDILRAHGTAAARVEGTPRRPTHFSLAVHYTRLDIARRMLTDDPNVVNIARADGRTAIFAPAFENNIEMLELLLSYHADVDVADEKGWRPIHAAATRGSLQAGRRLAAAGARLDGKGAPGGTTPLHLAAGGDHLDFIDFLVKERKVDVEQMDELGQTAVFRAVSEGRVCALQALLALGARIDRTIHEGTDKDFGWSLLHIAANGGHWNVIETLLAGGLDRNRALKNGFTALHLAAREGNAKTVRLLAESAKQAGASVDAPACDEWGTAKIETKIKARKTSEPDRLNTEFDMRPLHLAVKNNRLDAVRVLLDYADVNAVTGAGLTPLHVAAVNDRDDAARLLMLEQPDTEKRDAWGQTPLQSAIKAKNWSVARAMIEGGVSLEDCVACASGADALNLTPLQDAIAERDPQAVQFYLHNARNRERIVSQRGPLGRNALHLAVLINDPEKLRLILNASSDIFALDDDNMSAIHYAARKGADGALAQLLSELPNSFATNSSAINSSGAPTPLHLAAYSGRVAAVELLLSHGWMTDAPDNSGLSPFHRAVQSGVLESVQALAAAGAQIALPTADGRFNALNLAAQAGAKDVLAWLLESGKMRPDIIAPEGEAALVTAMRYRQYDMAVRLLDAGARPDVTTPVTGQSLLELYEHAIRCALARGEVAPRLGKLERALEKAGFTLTVIAEPTRLTPQSRGTAREASNPGATAFVLDDLPNGQTAIWHDMSGEELGGFLELVSPIDGKWPVVPPTTVARWRKLPWYDDIVLVRVQNAELATQKVHILYLRDSEGNLFRLNGTSPAIHEVNRKAPIKLSARNVLDYLRFFTYFVRGEEGPFYIAEDAADPLLPQFRDFTARSVLEGIVRPAAFAGIDERGNYLCSAVISYSNALFIANFSIQPTGMIEMLDDEPIAADLPGRVDDRLS